MVHITGAAEQPLVFFLGAFGTLPPRNNDLAMYIGCIFKKNIDTLLKQISAAFHWSSSVGKFSSSTFRLDSQTTRFHPVSSWNPFHWGSARYGLFCPCFEVGNLNQTSHGLCRCPKLDHGRWSEKRFFVVGRLLWSWFCLRFFFEKFQQHGTKMSLPQSPKQKAAPVVLWKSPTYIHLDKIKTR